jgi:hypothetical protein
VQREGRARELLVGVGCERRELAEAVERRGVAAAGNAQQVLRLALELLEIGAAAGASWYLHAVGPAVRKLASMEMTVVTSNQAEWTQSFARTRGRPERFTGEGDGEAAVVSSASASLSISTRRASLVFHSAGMATTP